MDLSHSQMRAALGVSATSLEVWLRHSLRQRAGRGRGNDPYVYELSDVVAALRLHRRKKLSPCDLVALCAYLDDKPPDAPLFDPDARASALIDVLTPEELQRFERAKRWLGQGAVFSFFDRLHRVDLPRALRISILRPTVLTYVMTADRTPQFPVTKDGWAKFATAHVHATATPNEIRNLTKKETYNVG